jgi:hypothetical protein
MGNSELTPLTSGWFSLTWGVSFSSYGAVSSVRFSIFHGIGDEYSLSSSRSMSDSFSLVSLSSLLIFHNSSIYLSSTSPGPTSFHNFSKCFAAFFIFLCHHFSTMAAIFRACSSLDSISCCFPHFSKNPLPSLRP